LEQAEVLIGVNGGTEPDSMAGLVRRYLGSARVQLLSLPREPVGAARNRLVARAAAPVLLFLDDDVLVPSDHLLRLGKVMQNPQVKVAGGPNLTPPRSSEFEHLAGRVLASPVGTGPLCRRYRTAASSGKGGDRNLIAAVLGVRRSALDGRCFDPLLAGAEENELLSRLGRRGVVMLHDPSLAVYHQRRGTLPSHLRQMFKYGHGRGQLFVRAFSPSQLLFTVPAFAVTVALAAAVLAPRVGTIVVTVYAAVLVAEALRLGRRRHVPTAFVLLAGTHLAYALGTTWGILSMFRTRVRSSI
jgi:GT2 family glycosyltransferase